MRFSGKPLTLAPTNRWSIAKVDHAHGSGDPPQSRRSKRIPDALGVTKSAGD
jgi:hypothetical protein